MIIKAMAGGDMGLHIHLKVREIENQVYLHRAVVPKYQALVYFQQAVDQFGGSDL